MASQKGTQSQRERLKDIDETVIVYNGQIQRCKLIQKTHNELIAMYREEQDVIECKITEINGEYADAPQKLISVGRQLDKILIEREKITGKVTGRTKRIKQYKKAKAKLDALLEDMAADGVDIENIEYHEEVSDYFSTRIS